MGGEAFLVSIKALEQECFKAGQIQQRIANNNKRIENLGLLLTQDEMSVEELDYFKSQDLYLRGVSKELQDQLDQCTLKREEVNGKLAELLKVDNE
jgi:hypothetical protein|tara:strand:- start:286 stop:573 length:288 start_codon:yes stop_codon:yes gene_type:complete